MDTLAEGDVTKWDQIWNMNVIEFLNLLSYKKAKAKYIANN